MSSELAQAIVSGLSNKGEGIGVIVTVSRIVDSHWPPEKSELGSLIVVVIIP